MMDYVNTHDFALLICKPEKSDPGGVGQFLIGEKAGLTMAYCEAALTGNFTVVVEKEQTHVALFGVAVNVDVITQRIVDCGQSCAVGQFAAEQAIDAFSAIFEIGPHPADQ